MAKQTRTNAELTAMIYERMKGFAECPPNMKVVVVHEVSPDPGWTALTNPQDNIAYADCAKRVNAAVRELRAIYDLVKD